MALGRLLSLLQKRGTTRFFKIVIYSYIYSYIIKLSISSASFQVPEPRPARLPKRIYRRCPYCLQMEFGQAEMFKHVEQSHRREVKHEGTVFSARRIASLFKPGIRLLDPGRIARHVYPYRIVLNGRMRIVNRIVERSLAEAMVLLGDERRRDDSKLIFEEFQKKCNKLKMKAARKCTFSHWNVKDLV